MALADAQMRDFERQRQAVADALAAQAAAKAEALSVKIREHKDRLARKLEAWREADQAEAVAAAVADKRKKRKKGAADEDLGDGGSDAGGRGSWGDGDATVGDEDDDLFTTAQVNMSDSEQDAEHGDGGDGGKKVFKARRLKDARYVNAANEASHAASLISTTDVSANVNPFHSEVDHAADSSAESHVDVMGRGHAGQLTKRKSIVNDPDGANEKVEGVAGREQGVGASCHPKRKLRVLHDEDDD